MLSLLLEVARAEVICDPIIFDDDNQQTARSLNESSFSHARTDTISSRPDTSGDPLMVYPNKNGPPYRVETGNKGFSTDTHGFTLLTDSTKQGYDIRKVLTDMHNYYRKIDAPDATYMNKLTYDFTLEAYAQQWATYLCTSDDPNIFEHSPNTHTGAPTWPFRITQGENLYVTSANANDPLEMAADVVTKWYNERAYYDWATGGPNHSHAGQPTGHYTQIVRQEATKLGCALVTNCRNAGWKSYLDCQYDYGNVGHFPYERNNNGKICETCPYGFTCCEDGLCTGAATSDDLKPFSKPQYIRSGWYSCNNWGRLNCHGTGATGRLPVASDLEFQQCVCNNASKTGASGYLDTVQNGVWWWRNRCMQLAAGNRRLEEEDSPRLLEELELNSDNNNIPPQPDIPTVSELLSDDSESSEQPVPWTLPVSADENLIKHLIDDLKSVKAGDIEALKERIHGLVTESALDQKTNNDNHFTPPPSIRALTRVLNPNKFKALLSAMQDFNVNAED